MPSCGFASRRPGHSRPGRCRPPSAAGRRSGPGLARRRQSTGPGPLRHGRSRAAARGAAPAPAAPARRGTRPPRPGPAASSMVFSHRGMPPAAGAAVPAGGTVPAARRRGGGGTGCGLPGPAGRRRWRRAPDSQHGPRADHVRVRTDDPPVGRVQRRPAASHRQPGRDTRECVTGLDRVPGRGPAGQHEDGAGINDIRVRADDRPVGRVQRRPAAAHVVPRRDARQRVTRLYHIPREGRATATGGHARRARQGDLSSTIACRCSPERWDDPLMPAASRTTRMPQASTAHADFVHARIVLPFLPRSSAPDAVARTPKNGPGKERT